MIDGRVIAAPGFHAFWNQFLLPKPPEADHHPFIRSLIYTSTRLRAAQVPVDSTDITAVQFQLDNRAFLAFSVYIPQIEGTEAIDNARTEQACRLIEETCLLLPIHEVIVIGDFNRHDQLWGGDNVGADQGGRIVDTMSTVGLESLLPRGRKTHESGSTIDLVLATASLASDLQQCVTWEEDCGSDHFPIATSFNLQTYTPSAESRYVPIPEHELGEGAPRSRSGT